VELELKTKWQVNLVAISHPGKEGSPPSINPVPLGNTVIRDGDILTVAGADEHLKRLLDGISG
jgi:Trk K+ transport system NAD-binding subunit